MVELLEVLDSRFITVFNVQLLRVVRRKELDHIEKVELLHNLDLGRMVHSLANSCLDAVESSVLQDLVSLLPLEEAHAVLNQRVEVVDLIPVDQIGQAVESVSDLIGFELGVVCEDIVYKQVHDVGDGICSNHVFEGIRLLNILHWLGLNLLDGLRVKGQQGIDYKFQ